MSPEPPASFLRAAGPVVAVAFALAFLSSFGQTYFIALSSPGIRAAFDLTHAGFGALYSAATLASGLLMIFAGGVLDRVSVRAYAGVALVGLAAAALAMSVVTHPALLLATLFGLRLFGQGMLAHAAITSAARLQAGLRGRATALASFGMTAGEGLLPFAAVAVLAAADWRALWQIAAATLVLALAAGAMLGPGMRTAARAAPTASREADPPPAPLSRRRILADPGFLLFLPAIAAPSAIVTGFFFHQREIAMASGWSLPLLAASISVFALVSVLGSLGAGALVDRIGALRVARFHLIPLAVAGLVLATVRGDAVAPLFFGLMGLTAGAGHVVSAAVLAELFGTRQLGRVRALGTAVMVVASATTPALAGLVLDAQASLAWLGLPAAGWAIAASALNARLRRRAPALP